MRAWEYPEWLRGAPAEERLARKLGRSVERVREYGPDDDEREARLKLYGPQASWRTRDIVPAPKEPPA